MSFWSDVVVPVAGVALPFVAFIALAVAMRWGFDRYIDWAEARKVRRDRW